MSGPAAAQLPADRGDSRDAGGVEQAEHKDGGGSQTGHHSGDAALSPVEDLKDRDHALLGHEAGDQGRYDPPVSQAQGPEDRDQQAGDRSQNAVMGGFHQIKMEVEALQEPDDHGGDQDDREGALEEVLCLFPEQLQDAARAGQAVVGQLHHEGDGLSLEDGPLEQQGRQDAADDAEQIEARHYEAALPREEGTDEEGVDRQLGRAAHKGGQENGHPAIPFTGQGPGGHDSRDRTAEADQHRHDAPPREADLPQELIHEEGHAGDIAAVLQDRKEEEHGHDDRQEAQN